MSTLCAKKCGGVDTQLVTSEGYSVPSVVHYSLKEFPLFLLYYMYNSMDSIHEH